MKHVRASMHTCADEYKNNIPINIKMSKRPYIEYHQWNRIQIVKIIMRPTYRERKNSDFIISLFVIIYTIA
jgi:hypothetical protein